MLLLLLLLLTVCRLSRLPLAACVWLKLSSAL